MDALDVVYTVSAPAPRDILCVSYTWSICLKLNLPKKISHELQLYFILSPPPPSNAATSTDETPRLRYMKRHLVKSSIAVQDDLIHTHHWINLHRPKI